MPPRRQKTAGFCSMRTVVAATLGLWALAALAAVVYSVRGSREPYHHPPSNLGKELGASLRQAAVDNPVDRPKILKPAAVLEQKPDSSLSKPPPAAVLRSAWEMRDHGPLPTAPAIIGSTWPPPDPRTLASRRSNDPSFPPKQPGARHVPVHVAARLPSTCCSF